MSGRAAKLACALLWTVAAPVTHADIPAAHARVEPWFTDTLDLPGRRHVFEDYSETFGLIDPPGRPVPRLKTTGRKIRRLRAERRHAVGRTCDMMLAHRTPRRDEIHNMAVADYLSSLAHDVVPQQLMVSEAGEETAHYRVLVRPNARHRSWLARLSGLLANQPVPVDLFIYPEMIGDDRHGAEFASTEEGPQLKLSSYDLPARATTIRVEHELFHMFQLQERALGHADAWPLHQIVSTEPERFEDYAADYIRWEGEFTLEEIGAWTRDAVQGTLASVTPGSTRFERPFRGTYQHHVDENRTGALSFVDASERLYDQALLAFNSNKVGAGDLVESDDGRSLKLGVTPGTAIVMPRTDARDVRAYVAAELRRGRAWIRAYRKFLN